MRWILYGLILTIRSIVRNAITDNIRGQIQCLKTEEVQNGKAIYWGDLMCYVKYTLHKHPHTALADLLYLDNNLESPNNRLPNTISPSNQSLRLVVQVALGTSAQPVFLSALLFIRSPRVERSYISWQWLSDTSIHPVTDNLCLHLHLTAALYKLHPNIFS